MRVTRALVSVAVLCLFVTAQAAAAPRSVDPAERLAAEFPRMARAVATPVAKTDAVRATQPSRFHEPVVLDGRAQRVVLRALDAAPIAPRTDNARASYARAFRGVDVLRANGYETLLVDDRTSLDAIAYNVVDMDGVSLVVPYGRAVRFVGATPGAPRADLTLSAPVVVGADGRVSYSARWVVANGGTRVATLRLKIDDPLVRYPVAITWAPVAASAAGSVTRIAPREVTTHGTGSISGRVTDALSGSPMPGTNVDIYYANGEYYDAGITDANGDYIVRGLDTGSYRAIVSTFDYQPQMYNNITCSPCDPTAGTPIAVTDGQQTTGISFALNRITGSTIFGTVRDAANNALTGVGVAIYDTTGQPVGFDDSDETGAYAATLADGGTYYARTFNNVYQGYVNQLYSGIDCSQCDVTTGTAITLTTGGSVSNIDFALKTNGGRISGNVTDSGSSAAITTGSVFIYDSTGRLATFGYTDDTGAYTSWHGLASGNYYAVAHAGDHESEIYSETACGGAGCDPLTGTAIAVTLGSTATGVDFTLPGASGRIRGTVTDSTTQAALGGVYVYVYDSTGNLIVAAESSYEDGSYEAILAEGGTYYARTFNFVNEGYADELYQDFPCTRCDVTTGTAIQVTAGAVTTGINFTLSQTGGWIAGRVLDTNQAAIEGSYVIIYGSDGSIVTYAIPDANGNYTAFNRLDAGTYYAIASADNHDSELYNGISCANGCTPTQGTAIEVTAGQTTGGIDFFLAATGCGTVSISPDSLPSVRVSEPYSQQLTVSGATGTVTWSVVDGALPTGMTLNSSTGLISGTCNNVGSYTFVVQVVDANNCSALQRYTIEVTGDPTSITVSVFPNPGQQGYPVTLTATVTPSAAPGTVNFSVDGFFVGSAPLTDGIAQIDVTVGLGTHHAVAAYSGGGTYSPSVSVDPNDPNDEGVEFVIQKGQPPIVWNNPADITYGTALSSTQLNARVVINEGEDPNDPADDATLSGTYVYTPPAGTILDAGTHTLSVTFHPDDTENWDSATKTVTIVVHKANQTIEWNDPAPITYGTALSSTQLNATVTVVGPAPAGALTYNPDFGAILDAGTQTLTVTAAATNNYNSATASVTLIVNKANQQIVWADPDPIVYGTPLGANELDATVNVVGPAPAGALVYNPAAGTILNAGTHTLSVSAAETNNYNPASASVTLTVLKATPVFSNLSSPTIIIGTTSATISGKLSHGTFIPTGSVTITLNGVPQSAAIQPDGTFSSTFVTAALTTTLGGYPLSFSYGGDANFNPANGSSTLYVTYGIAGGPNPPVAANPGSAIPMRITLRNAQGVNLSSPLITVTAAGIRAPGGAFYPVSGTFNFTNSQGGAYTFILHTPNTLTPGTYAFEFTVQDDPVTHSVNFQIK